MRLHHAALGFALALAGPAAAGPPVPLPTEIAQQLTLGQAAQAGLLSLSAKGGISGDQVAVDLSGALVPGAPVTIATRIEFFGTQADGSPWPPSKAAEFEAAVEGRLASLAAADGTPVTFDVDARVRTGSTPSGGTAGYHQIELKDFPEGGGPSFTGMRPLGVARTGSFGAHETASVWAHEVLHLAGLPDRYSKTEQSYVVNGNSYPLPTYTGDGSPASLAAFFENVLKPAWDALEAQYGRGGRVEQGVPPGLEGDIMANPDSPDATITLDDLGNLVDLAGVRVQGRPGDLLLDKDGYSQNFGVGAPLDLYAARGGNAHVDGLFVYCLDLLRDVPAVGQLFDVLGPAADEPEPQLAALHAVLEEIGRRQDPEDPFPPPGAQTVVWALTEGDGFLLEEDELGILADAGVVYDEAFFASTPHLSNPNAAGPATAAVTRSEVLPPLEIVTGPSPVPPDELEGPPQLLLATVDPSLVMLGTSGPLELIVLVENASDALELSVERRKGRKWKPVGETLQRGANVGISALELPMPAKKGKYRVRVVGQNDELVASFQVKKRRS